MICRCVTNVQGGLASILNYVTTVKGLAAIRDELWNLLQHVSLVTCKLFAAQYNYNWFAFSFQLYPINILRWLDS